MSQHMSQFLPQLRIAALALASVLSLALTAQPAAAATKAEKMETCKAGADHDKLTGAKRTAFINKCMGTANYEPKARLDALKQAKTKPAAASTPAPASADEPEEKPQ